MKRIWFVGSMGLFFLIGFIVLWQAHSEKELFVSQSLKGTVYAGDKVIYTADLEVARTPQEIERGLMHRTAMQPQQGMLFWFQDEQPRSFWMRNTLIPLDMVFITSTGRITNIIHSASPKTETLRSSTEPVQYVVELPGGTAATYGIVSGHRFAWNE